MLIKIYTKMHFIQIDSQSSGGGLMVIYNKVHSVGETRWREVRWSLKGVFCERGLMRDLSDCHDTWDEWSSDDLLNCVKLMRFDGILKASFVSVV
jgi:hypothetical protein